MHWDLERMEHEEGSMPGAENELAQRIQDTRGDIRNDSIRQSTVIYETTGDIQYIQPSSPNLLESIHRNSTATA